MAHRALGRQPLSVGLVVRGRPRRSRVNFFGKGLQRLGFVDYADGLTINNSSSPSPARLSGRQADPPEPIVRALHLRWSRASIQPGRECNLVQARPPYQSYHRHSGIGRRRYRQGDRGRETASRPLPVPSGGSASTRTDARVLLPMSHIHTAREFSWLVVLGVVVAGDGLFLGSSVLVGAALAAPAVLVASYSRRCRLSAARPLHTSLPSLSSQRARPLAEATDIAVSRWENEGGARSPNVRSGESEARRSAR